MYRLRNYTGDGAIAPFSSYATDVNGDEHPFICAPGNAVVAPVSKYCTSVMNTIENYGAYRVMCDDDTYDYWRYMTGTSMAAPVAAGVAALWLEADPNLDYNGVKEVIRNTAITDEQMPARNVRWGYGKIDALSGIEYILQHKLVGDVNGDGVVSGADVTALYGLLLDGNEVAGNPDVNGDGQVNGSDVTALYNIILGN